MEHFNQHFDKKTALKSTAVNVAFRFGMQTAQPFEIKKDDDFSFRGTKDLENRQWLTSLQIKLGKDKIFTFNEVVISVTQERTIVTTPLQGRDGTIKEFISNGDYIISVDAGVMSVKSNPDNEDTAVSFEIPKNKYPEAALRKLKKIILAKQSIAVQSVFLDVFGIKTVVVKSFNLVQETHSNRQSIQITMLSDEPYEIKKIKEDYVEIE